MTEEEFKSINWRRGNFVRLMNGNEYIVKGTKCHGRYLLLYSVEYGKLFVADHNIVDCRTSDFEEPEEIYLERKRQRQAEAEAKREAERQEYLRLKAERKRHNIEEQERIHQEAVARKAARARERTEKAIAFLEQPLDIPPVPKLGDEDVIENIETTPEQPKRKRKRITIPRIEKVDINKF